MIGIFGNVFRFLFDLAIDAQSCTSSAEVNGFCFNSEGKRLLYHFGVFSLSQFNLTGGFGSENISLFNDMAEIPQVIKISDTYTYCSFLEISMNEVHERRKGL